MGRRVRFHSTSYGYGDTDFRQRWYVWGCVVEVDVVSWGYSTQQW